MKHTFRKLTSIILSFILVLSCVGVVQAAEKITLPDLISDNMLIQRDMPVKLWGYGGNPGDTLTVQFEDKDGKAVNKGSTTIGDDGFEIELPAMEAGGPYTIRFKDKDNKNVASVYNVLIGDLWFQGGQSNMQYRISSIPGSVEERVAPAPKDDTIRLFYNGNHFRAEEPATDLPGQWIVADKNNFEYSAVGYKALETIHNSLDIPVGGICSPYGGTTLAAFNNKDHDIYKAKIAPVTQFNIKGVMWYQGEGDCAEGKTAEEIESGYKQLVSLFRKEWNNNELPFMMVQIHQSKMLDLVYGSTTDYMIYDYSPVRIAQTNLYLSDKNVGMAVAMDLSLQKYKDSGEDPLHPWIKAPVGERLGNTTLEMVYGKNIKSKSPVYTNFELDGNKVKITVKDAYSGLKTSDGKEPWGFRLAGEDGIYYEAKAVISGDTITLSSDKVASPVTASYGIEKHIWQYSDIRNKDDVANAPKLPDFPVNVVNSEGLPLGAFDTSFNVASEIQTTITEDEKETDSAPSKNVTIEQTGNKLLLYVATNGNDSNPGTIDKPLASIFGARDKIHELQKSGGIPEDGAVVYFRGGDYVIKSGIEFGEEHSGTADAPIVYRNYPGEEVNFLGAAKLDWSKFKKVTDTNILNRIVDEEARNHVLEIDLFKLGYTELSEPSWPGPYSYGYQLPELTSYLEEHGKKKPEAESSALFINGSEMTLARYPNDKQMVISQVIEPGSVTPATPFEVVFEDTRIRNWTTADQAIITGTPQYSWGTLSTDLGSVNTERLSITAKYPTQHLASLGQHLHVYNLLEEIDIPNEYFVDIKTGKLYIYPPEEDVQDVYYTILDKNMFWFKANTKNITLKGINMKFMRAGAVVIGQHTDNIQVINCEMTGAAGQTVTLNGSENCKIIDCYIHDSEGGIQCVKSGNRDNLTRGNNIIENNVIRNVEGKKVTYQPAINLTGVGNTARYNDISGSQHTVLCLGGNYHVVEFNEIYDACSNTDDMGAIYTGRDITHRGNIFRYNYIHDIGSPNRGNNGVHGMFFDDWWSAADVVGNVFENITGAGIMLAGSYNVMDNNLFINCKESMRLNRSYNYGGTDYEAEILASLNAVPYKSEAWTTAFPGIENALSEDGKLDMNNYIVATNNVLYNSPEPTVGGDIAKTITNKNNVVFSADPGFYDIENRIYVLKEDSEIFEKIPEFTPIPHTRMGSYSERAINRVKNAYVFCIDSPFVIKKGELVNEGKTVVKVMNNDIYVPLRMGVDAVGGSLSFDEETNSIEIVVGNKKLEFTDGASANLKLNGVEYTLKKPVVNMDYTNYISVTDITEMFDTGAVYSGDMVVLSSRKNLFNPVSDAELLRYLEEQVSIY